MADFHLSVGSLLPIMNDVNVEDPMMQILQKEFIQTISSSGTKLYRILISDIANSTSLSMITVGANYRLEPYSIIKLKKYETGLINRSTTPKKVLLIMGWVKIVKGGKIGRTIGAPEPVEEEKGFRISQNRDQLSAGSLWIIIDDQKVKDPVMQVLDSREVRYSSLAGSRTDKVHYRLVLSDGVNSTSLAMMYKSQPNAQQEIETYSVIRLKKYITCGIKSSATHRKKTILLILEKEVVVDGNGTGKKTIGDPKSID